MRRVRLVATLLPALWLAGQDHVIRVTSRMVEVDVVVHDKAGAAVRNLVKDDFTLFDNGKPRTISSFSVVTREAKANRRPLPPNVFSNHLARQTGAAGDVTILLLDGMNTQPLDQARAIPHVARFVEKLDPGEPIALYTLGLDGLHIVQDFTTDTARLQRALAGRRLRNAANLDGPTETGGPPAFAAFAETSANLMVQAQIIYRVKRTMDAIEAIANHVAGIPGRKSLLWVSSAFPFTLGLEQAAMAGTADVKLQLRTLNAEVAPALRRINRANLAIYPVDARGLRGTAAGEAGSRVASGRFTGTVTRNEINTMQIVAERTGGRAFFDTNDLEGALRQAADDSVVTYLLGFYPPPEALDGKIHDLKVEVKRKGVKARWRVSYEAVAETAAADRLKEDLATAVSSPLSASDVRLTASLFRTPEAPGAVRLMLDIPPGDLTVEQRGTRWLGAAQVVIVRLVAGGSSPESLNDVINIDLNEAQYAGFRKDGLSIAKDVPLVPGLAQIRVVVVDRPSGRVGSVAIPIGAR
jgi:VWFA-related protein